nr:PREDICTED: glioma pathogenesis-related protein 1 [Latimeria chalumnae]|eukprot:XP_006011411.2 PREDICTED: glioma pathogenesis-related protein 1 [Latimeria chalumnae]
MYEPIRKQIRRDTRDKLGGAKTRKGAAPDIEDRAFIEECVRVHNFHRSAVKPPASNMQYMSWDRTMAQTARTWARNCRLQHNIHLKEHGRLHPNFSTLGENIWVGSSFDAFNVTSAIAAWNNEVQYYNYKTRTCTKVCGHYTQVVWADSYKVGCAVHICTSGIAGFSVGSRSAIFVCNYGPPGNYPTHPYLTGQPCSKCQEKCFNNLCSKCIRKAKKALAKYQNKYVKEKDYVEFESYQNY